MRKIIVCILIVASAQYLNAQGCSDAGICTIDVLKPSSGSSLRPEKNKLEAGILVGAADYSITVFGAGIGYTRKFGESWSVDTRMTFLSQSGNDISVRGPGDIFANVNYQVSQKFTLTAGAKIPLMQADRRYDNLPLPMDYQSSLGTLDLLAGIRFTPEKWQWALALQWPLRQNDNAFLPGLYPPESPLYEIQATNAFHRQPDLMLHVSRTLDMGDKITFTPGLLPIWHMGEDEYTDIDGITYAIAGSDGLTLNGTVFIDVETGSSGSLEFSLGFPFIVRDARPDGLTRSFVFGVGYAHVF